MYPAGFALILVASLISRSRNKGNSETGESGDDSARMKFDRSIRMQKAMERLDFATKSQEQQKRVSSSQDYEEEY